MSVLGWLGGRSLTRLDNLERNAVTRDDLEKALNHMRNDRLLMHQENREHLSSIEEKIDEDRETINQIARDVAVLASKNHR